MNESNQDELFAVDEEKLEALRTSRPWMANPKHFKRVKIGPSATIKMISHGQSGVEKGINKGGKPIEVMGLLLGRPDVNDTQCFVITDAKPLPIEGFETRVIADDESTINYMIELGEINEASGEKFCGWYHTHPFDLDVNGHCFLSSTDISTQLQWQRSEDPHGNPWLAIVVDPIRTIAKSKPEIKAFRVYPPEYASPIPFETPDGSVVTEERQRVEKWGVCWNRYYELEISYFMSSLARSTLGKMKNKFLWQNSFTSAFVEQDQKKIAVEQVGAIVDSINAVTSSSSHSKYHHREGGDAGAGEMTTGSSGMSLMDVVNEGSGASGFELYQGGGKGFSAAAKSAKDFTMNQCQGCASIMTKYALFCETKHKS